MRHRGLLGLCPDNGRQRAGQSYVISSRMEQNPQGPTSRRQVIVPADVLQLSGRLAGDVKESPHWNPTRDLQMATDRTRPHSAAMLADSLAGENPARGTCPVATVVISGDGAGD